MEFPGGKQEQGETIEICIARELKEELGIAVTVGAELITVDHAYSHKKLRFVVHLCDWVSGEPRPLASQKVLWVHLDDLGNYAFPAANARIIEALLGSKKVLPTLREGPDAVGWRLVPLSSVLVKP